jgi:hypothetical protein
LGLRLRLEERGVPAEACDFVGGFEIKASGREEAVVPAVY